MPLRYGQSPWLAQYPKTRRPAYPKLSAPLEIPVAIVGGGLTGCVTAYALAAAGVRTALFEADRIATGATAQAAGMMFATPSVDYLALEKAHGRRVARALWQDTRRAALDAQALLRRLKVRCNLQPADAIVAARTDAEAKVLRKELGALRDAGIDGAWITAKALAQATGLEGVGGLKTPGHAWLDPYRAAHGLARAAAVRGAAIFERTPISAVRHGRSGVELAAGKFRIKAGTIIVATGSAAPSSKRSRAISSKPRPTPCSRRRLPPTCGERPARAKPSSSTAPSRRIGSAGRPTIGSCGPAPISRGSPIGFARRHWSSEPGN